MFYLNPFELPKTTALNMMRIWLGSAGACFLLAFLAPPVDAHMPTFTAFDDTFDAEDHSKFEEGDSFEKASNKALDGYTDTVLLEKPQDSPQDAAASETQLEETFALEASIHKSKGLKRMIVALSIFLLFTLVLYLEGDRPSKSVEDKNILYRASRKFSDSTRSFNNKMGNYLPFTPDIDSWVIVGSMLMFALGAKRMVDSAVRRRDSRKGRLNKFAPPVEGVFFLAVSALALFAHFLVPFMYFFMAFGVPHAIVGLFLLINSLVKRHKFHGRHQAKTLGSAQVQKNAADDVHQKTKTQ